MANEVNCDRPVFVVGTPRSGTTLTARILGRHPDLFMPGETHYLDDIYARRKELGLPDDPHARHRIFQRLSTLYGRYYELPDQERIDRLFVQPSGTPDHGTMPETYRDIFAWFMTLQMRDAGKRRWGNNAPRDLFSYADIAAFFPDARFIICVRDIRDFLLSYQGKWKVTGEEHAERLKHLYHPVVTSLLWKTSMRTVERICRTLPAQNWVLVKYENLVIAPEREVGRICKTAGLEYFDSLLDVSGHNSSEIQGGSAKGIFTSSIGRWRDRLSGEETAVAQQLAGAEMRRLGYKTQPMRVNVLRWMAIWLKTPVALWRGLKANRDVRGPLLPYLFKRVIALIR